MECGKEGAPWCKVALLSERCSEHSADEMRRRRLDGCWARGHDTLDWPWGVLMIGYGTSSSCNIKVLRNTAGKGKYTHSGERKVQFSFQTVEIFPWTAYATFVQTKMDHTQNSFPDHAELFNTFFRNCVEHTWKWGGKSVFNSLILLCFSGLEALPFITK